MIDSWTKLPRSQGLKTTTRNDIQTRLRYLQGVGDLTD